MERAGDLFHRRGYHATSMRDLAHSLNLQGSSLYAHIASKEELLATIVDEAADAFLGAARAVDPRLSPSERLRALVRGHLRVIAAELPRASVFFHEWSHLPEAMRSEVVARRDAYQEHFRSTIADGVADGSFAVPDVDLATLFALSALNWTYQWLDPAGRLPIEDVAERYADMLLGALGAAPASAAREETA